VTNPELARDRDVKLWFEQANNVLFKHRYSPKPTTPANSMRSILASVRSALPRFSLIFTTRGALRYRRLTCARFLFDMSHQGVVDTSYRKFSLTARQMQQKVEVGRWDKIPDAVDKSVKDHPDKTFEIIHCVRPRLEIDKSKADFRGKEYASYYVSVEGQMVLSEGGYNTFPYSVSRYVTGPGEIYGRSLRCWRCLRSRC
jgi:hypothetical protein